MDVVPRGKIHNVIRPPAGRPDHLLHFLLNRGSHSGVADVGIDLYQKVSPDDHGLTLWVIDVSWDNGSAAGDFGADEFRGNQFGERRPETISLMGLRCAVATAFQGHLPTQVFANGDVLHLGCNNTLFRVMHLRDVLTSLRAQDAPTRHLGEAFHFRLEGGPVCSIASCWNPVA